MSGDAIIRMLKQATKDLCNQFDNQTNAGHVIDKCQQTISRFGDTNSVSDVITLPDLVRLEGAAKEPSVTQLLCKLAGGRFVRTVEPGLDDSGLADALMACVKEVGDVADAFREGRRDGSLDQNDLENLVRQLDELVDVALAGRALGASVLARMGIKAVVPIDAARRGGEK